jgi:hypothetical protein
MHALDADPVSSSSSSRTVSSSTRSDEAELAVDVDDDRVVYGSHVRIDRLSLSPFGVAVLHLQVAPSGTGTD